MAFIQHELIRSDKVEVREYQQELSRKCIEENTLVVIPTGLGKTVIALLVIAEYLKKFPEKKCLLLAPTKPLVYQHYRLLESSLLVRDIQIVTGENPPEDRKKRWEARVICATPQVAEIDMRKGLVSSQDFSLVIFDEAHRAVGNYSYHTIGSVFSSKIDEHRIIGLTASLPSNEETANSILKNLGLKRVELRTEKSNDVKPYIQRTNVTWLKLTLPPLLSKISAHLRLALTQRFEILKTSGLLHANVGNATTRKLLELRGRSELVGNNILREALFSSIRIQHALTLLEIHGTSSFLRFFDRLRNRDRGFGVKGMFEDMNIHQAYELAIGASVVGEGHPKLSELEKILRSLGENERAIIFTSYRDSVEDICRHLLSKGFRVSKLIGKSGEGGQTQSKQIETLRGLRGGVFNILVATQIGEEGLDIAECNRVIFYDNVSSAVRFIQRRGRTGRREQGNVTILVTKGTQDEAYYWMSKKRLSSTIQTAEKLEQSNLPGPMDKFVGSHEIKLPVVYADARETHDIAENLRQHGARVEVKLLEIGDFVLSDEIVIERKNIDDFVKSIFDGRLFSQIIAMKEVYPKPILIIQGTDKRSLTVGAQSFYGALASIVGDFQVPIFTSKDSQETAELIFHLARREQIDKKKEVRIREGRKPMTTRELQKYVVAGIPGISTVLADRLLSKFRSPEGVFTATEDSLKSVEGIGEKLARRIRELASVPYI